MSLFSVRVGVLTIKLNSFAKYLKGLLPHLNFPYDLSCSHFFNEKFLIFCDTWNIVCRKSWHFTTWLGVKIRTRSLDPPILASFCQISSVFTVYPYSKLLAYTMLSNFKSTFTTLLHPHSHHPPQQISTQS